MRVRNSNYGEPNNNKVEKTLYIWRKHNVFNKYKGYNRNTDGISTVIALHYCYRPNEYYTFAVNWIPSGKLCNIIWPPANDIEWHYTTRVYIKCSPECLTVFNEHVPPAFMTAIIIVVSNGQIPTNGFSRITHEHQIYIIICTPHCSSDF